MKILLANPRGFCAGVRMAIDALELVLDRLGPPVYVFHEIVHNQHVVADFRRRGVVFVDSVQEVPPGEVLMYSAHGVSPEIREAARQRQLRTVDATCPLVTKVHLEAISLSKSGHILILIGHAGHDEVVGTIGEAPDAFHLVESIEDVERLDFSRQTPLAWMTQTTLSVSETQRIVDRLKERFPQIVGPRKDDICYATQNRQLAVRGLCEEAQAIVVVGSRNSSNSKRLRETALQAGIASILVDDSSELSADDFRDYETIAITAGASAPEAAVQDVVNWFVTQFDANVESRTFANEQQVFAMPKELATLEPEQRSFPIPTNKS
ncbi:MAG: 4-hydroxy-3-methylbut-2-enyl diphosphate reductase [Pirellulaceae bacterium]|nr:4-hydroxy-3-methylbut-2-enyl diphosphate reductase [Pirellulaceae bacterium]